jgi:hypothetical protein
MGIELWAWQARGIVAGAIRSLVGGSGVGPSSRIVKCRFCDPPPDLLNQDLHFQQASPIFLRYVKIREQEKVVWQTGLCVLLHSLSR